MGSLQFVIPDNIMSHLKIHYLGVLKEYAKLKDVSLEEYLCYFMLESSDIDKNSIRILPNTDIRLTGVESYGKFYVDSIYVNTDRTICKNSVVDNGKIYGISDGTSKDVTVSVPPIINNLITDGERGVVTMLSSQELDTCMCRVKASEYRNGLRVYKSISTGEFKVYDGNTCILSTDKLLKIKFDPNVVKVLEREDVIVKDMSVESDNINIDDYIQFDDELEDFKFKGMFKDRDTFLVTKVFTSPAIMLNKISREYTMDIICGTEDLVRLTLHGFSTAIGKNYIKGEFIPKTSRVNRITVNGEEIYSTTLYNLFLPVEAANYLGLPLEILLNIDQGDLTIDDDQFSYYTSINNKSVLIEGLVRANSLINFSVHIIGSNSELKVWDPSYPLRWSSMKGDRNW